MTELPEAGDDAERFWEDHYAGHDQVWSGNPNPALVETAAALEPGRALDLGSGEGGDAVHLASHGWHVTAVDISATALARTRAHAEAAGVADRVTTERHDLSATFPEGSFDLVGAHFLHSPVDFPRADVLRRAAESLTPDGLLLVVEHGSSRPWARHPDTHTDFPTPREVYDSLHLDPALFRPDRLESPRREATGPDGEHATVIDIVTTVRRTP